MWLSYYYYISGPTVDIGEKESKGVSFSVTVWRVSVMELGFMMGLHWWKYL